ncbi:MAG: YihY/virulence factor BrkB family protein [Sphingorhabdus sp.]
MPIKLGGNARHFWQIPARGWWNILRRTYTETNDDNLSVVAAGVAFYIFLAFVPLLASIVLIYGLAVDRQQVAEHILLIATNLPQDIAGIISDQLKAITSEDSQQTGMGLLFALLLSIYGTTRGSSSMIAAMNQVYGEREKRGFIKLTLITVALALGAIFTGICAILAISATTLLSDIMIENTVLEKVISIIAWLVVALLISTLVATIYRYGPSRSDARWSWLIPGALFASFGCFAGTALFGWYVSNISSYSATYGALGAVVTFLMWLFVSTYIILVGAELNAELERQTAHDTTEGPDEPMGKRGARMADTVETGPVVRTGQT